MTAAPLLAARGVEFRFGARPVLRGLSLELRRGESMALFGPNGAGKTTLLRVLATLLRPTRGEILMDGISAGPRRERFRFRARIGFLSHQSMLYERLSGRENLRFFARMYRLGNAAERCARLIDLMGLSGREDDPVAEYSRGMQQRLALARAVIHDPDLLLLDEPFSGLDPGAASKLGALLTEWTAAGKTILFTSHDLQSGLHCAHRVGILAGGTLSFQASRESASLDALTRAYATLAGRGA